VIWHPRQLIAALVEQRDCLHHVLIKEPGQAEVAGQRTPDHSTPGTTSTAETTPESAHETGGSPPRWCVPSS